MNGTSTRTETARPPHAREAADAPTAARPEIPSIATAPKRAGALIPSKPGNAESHVNGARVDPPRIAGEGPSETRNPTTASAGNTHVRAVPALRRARTTVPASARASVIQPANSVRSP